MNYSEKLSNVSEEIQKAVKAKVDGMEEGKTIMFFGKRLVVPTDEASGLIVRLSDSEEDSYYELPYGYIYDKHGHPMQYKIAGVSKEGNEIYFHLHNWEESVEYRHEDRCNIDVSLEVMADIADML